MKGHVNGKKARNPALVAMGQRLKQAALGAGFKSADDLAQTWGVSKQKVYRWWNGDHERLPADEVRRYAEMTGADEVWLWTGKTAEGVEDGVVPQSEGDRLVTARAYDMLLDFMERVVRGDDAGAAFKRVAALPDEISPREQRRLSLDSDLLRSKLAEVSGVPLEELAALSPEDLRAALQQALALARHFRGQ